MSQEEDANNVIGFHIRCPICDKKYQLLKHKPHSEIVCRCENIWHYIKGWDNE